MKFYYLSKYMQGCEEFNGSTPCKQQNAGIDCLSCPEYKKTKRALLCCFGSYGECLTITSQIKALKEHGFKVDILTTQKMSVVFRQVNENFVNLIISSNDYVKMSKEKYDLIFSVEKDKKACSLLSYYLASDEAINYAFFGFENGQHVIYASSNDTYKLMLYEFDIGHNNKLFRSADNREDRVTAIYKTLNIDLGNYDLSIGVSQLSRKKGENIGVMCNTGAAFGGPSNRVPHINKIAELFRRIKTPYSIFLLGGAADKEINFLLQKRIELVAPQHCVVNTTGFSLFPPYDELFDTINSLEIIICPDTLVRHIARACYKKTFTFMSSTKTNDFKEVPHETLLKNRGDKACQCFGSEHHICWENDCWMDDVLQYIGG